MVEGGVTALGFVLRYFPGEVLRYPAAVRPVFGMEGHTVPFLPVNNWGEIRKAVATSVIHRR